MKKMGKWLGLIGMVGLLLGCQPDNANVQNELLITSTQTNELANQVSTKSPIKARQDLMHRWGKAHRHLQTMSKDPAKFDVNQLQSHIAIIDTSQEQMWAYFDDNTLSIPNSKVNRLIKENPNDYQAHIERFTTAFNELKHTAHRTPHLDTLTPLIEKVNQECKACHRRYKKRG